MPRWRIDHINGNHGDNRWSNLREGDRMQKGRHRGPRRQPTGVPGVWRVGERFEAMVEVEGATVNLGSFLASEEAIAAIAQVHRRACERDARNRPQAARTG